MLGFWKSKIERKLLKLGHTESIAQYRKQLKAKEISKHDFNRLLTSLWEQQKAKWEQRENVNVATRQSFIDDDTLVPLNLHQIQTIVYDFDFIKNKIFFEYKNTGSIPHSLVDSLFEEVKKDPLFKEILTTDFKHTEELSTEQCIQQITDPYHEENRIHVFQAFLELEQKK